MRRNMKKKENKVRSIAEAGMQKLTDSQFEEKFVEQNYRVNKQKVPVHKTSKFKLAMSALACALIIAIVIPCVLLIAPDDGQTSQEDPPRFGWTPGGSEYVDIQAVNAELQDYYVVPDYVGGSSIVLTRDKDTNEKLYYVFTWENGFKSCMVYMAVKENMDCSIWEREPEKSVIINGLQVQYRHAEKDYYPDEGVYVHKCYGQLNIGAVRIFFCPYTALTENVDSGFEEFVEQFIVKK